MALQPVDGLFSANGERRGLLHKFRSILYALTSKPLKDRIMSQKDDFSIHFIGGGNMASAMIGGLLRHGCLAKQLTVVDPDPNVVQRHQASGLNGSLVFEAPTNEPDMVIWAVKPQSFKAACTPVAPHTRQALHLSVAAGLTTDALSSWLGTERIVRAMPNTPALIGLGQAGLYARPAVSLLDKERINQVMHAIGQSIWVPRESDLDAVTAISGSGPAYVFYFLEAMMDAAQRMGLSAQTATQLAVGTFEGATALAKASSEPPGVLRERVTSKGGTTFAALEHMRAHQLNEHFVQALMAARHRAEEMGKELGSQ